MLASVNESPIPAQPMKRMRVGKVVIIDGEKYERIPFGAECEYDGSEWCGDCSAIPGKLHEFGCDVEECPSCGGQFAFCNCAETKRATAKSSAPNFSEFESVLKDAHEYFRIMNETDPGRWGARYKFAFNLRLAVQEGNIKAARDLLEEPPELLPEPLLQSIEGLRKLLQEYAEYSKS